MEINIWHLWGIVKVKFVAKIKCEKKTPQNQNLDQDGLNTLKYFRLDLLGGIFNVSDLDFGLTFSRLSDN